MSWILDSLLPLLSVIPLPWHPSSRWCIRSWRYHGNRWLGHHHHPPIDCWFSETWTRTQLTPFLAVPKNLQRYSTLHPGKLWPNYALYSLSMKSANHVQDLPTFNPVPTKANINHGFSTTEVLSDITKLVSMTQLRCSTLCIQARRTSTRTILVLVEVSLLLLPQVEDLFQSQYHIWHHTFSKFFQQFRPLEWWHSSRGQRFFFFFSFPSFSPSLHFFPSSLSLSLSFSFLPFPSRSFFSLLSFLFPFFFFFSPSPSSHFIQAQWSPLLLWNAFSKGKHLQFPYHLELMMRSFLTLLLNHGS